MFMVSGTIIPEQFINKYKIMGGKMNLNPLQQDSNTDALVKALEDANNVGAASPAVAPDAALADAQQSATTDAGITTPDPAVIDPSLGTSTADDTTPAGGVTFDGNDLPMGLSTDADAHLSGATAEGTGDSGELDGVKRSALEQLRPLIEKIDLEPADKFDKYLMMLRASDDPALIKPAFDAAQGIEGEKEKAQALLDIINEINYITASQQQAS